MTKEVQIEDGELTQAALQLYITRKALKHAEGQEAMLKDRVRELVTNLEHEKGTVFTTRRGLQIHIVEAEGRKTLNKDLLIDAGVLPSQIEKGYKKGEGYTRVEVKTS